MAISCVTVVKNEEGNIRRMLKSVRNWVDEIVVVDMQSVDKTVEIASLYTKRIFSYPDVGYVEPARNFSIQKAKGEWVLVLDADEEIPTTLARKLQEIAKKQQVNFCRIPRKNIIFTKWIKHSRWWPDYNIRFFRKGFVSWKNKIHSIPITRGKGIDLAAVEDNAIVHYHYTSVDQFLARMNIYTTRQAEFLINEGYKFSWIDLIEKPIAEFLSRYFASEGYKDGVHGLALAGLQSFSELVLYLKIWQKQGFQKKNISLKNVVGEMRKLERDMHYWQADALLHTEGGLVERLRRKFKL